MAESAPEISYGLSGRLVVAGANGRPWCLLEVPNHIVKGLFLCLSEPGVSLPLNRKGKLRAHITVITPGEIEQIGGPQKITERGKRFSWNTGLVRSVRPKNWGDVGRVWFMECKSPELKRLRQSYGLPPLPHGHEFHITFAVRKKGVLGANEMSKVAAIQQLLTDDQLKEVLGDGDACDSP